MEAQYRVADALFIVIMIFYYYHIFFPPLKKSGYNQKYNHSPFLVKLAFPPKKI